MRDLSNTLKIVFMNMVSCVLIAIFNKVYENATEHSYKNAISRFQDVFETYMGELKTNK